MTHGLGIPLSKVGFPIRKSADQSFFAAPHGLSQRSTSFIASQRQGIHRMPLRHLIALIINAHPLGSGTVRSFASELAFLANSSTGWTLIRKTSLLRIVPTACGQAADIRHRRDLVASRLASRTTSIAFECSEIAHRTRLSSRPTARSDPTSSRCQISRTCRAALRPCGDATDAELFSRRTSRSNPDWWSQTGSNRRPPACKAGALPTELWPLRDQHQQHQQAAPMLT